VEASREIEKKSMKAALDCQSSRTLLRWVKVTQETPVFAADRAPLLYLHCDLFSCFCVCTSVTRRPDTFFMGLPLPAGNCAHQLPNDLIAAGTCSRRRRPCRRRKIASLLSKILKFSLETALYNTYESVLTLRTGGCFGSGA
jgi:hypothetical protein